MGSSGGGGGGTYTVEIKHPAYIEDRHKTALELSFAYGQSIIGHSPYKSYDDLQVDDSFFGYGYAISSFESLYGTFGRKMAGINIDELFTSAFSSKINSMLSDDVIETEASIIDEAVDAEQGAKLEARRLNAVNSTTMIIAQSNIESNRIKKISELRGSVKYSMTPEIVNSWTSTMSWDKSVVVNYAQGLKNYYLCRTEADAKNYQKGSENALWPFTVLDYERSMLTILRGGRTSRTLNKRERSDISKALVIASYTAQGAAIGGPIGAIIGFTVGVGMIFLE